LLFEWVSYRRKAFTLHCAAESTTVLRQYFLTYGDGWPLDQKNLQGYIQIAADIAEQIFHADCAESDIAAVATCFADKFSLALSYTGELVKLHPTAKHNLRDQYEEESIIAGLNIFLHGAEPDAVSSKISGKQCCITLEFLDTP
jgi:hypothetical protein